MSAPDTPISLGLLHEDCHEPAHDRLHFDGRTCMSAEDADAASHLGTIPDTDRGRELWFQNEAGYILNRDAGLYAVRRLDPDLTLDARAAALKTISDTLYGVCMIADGVTGGISTPEGHTSVSIQVDHQPEAASSTMPFRLDLFEGDGACMGYHAWIEGNFRLGLDRAEVAASRGCRAPGAEVAPNALDRRHGNGPSSRGRDDGPFVRGSPHHCAAT